MASGGIRGNRRLRPFILALCLIVSLSTAAAVSADVLLTIVVQDYGSGETVSARCSVIDSLGNSRFPDIHSSLYHSYGGGYFYCDGDFTVSVATGPALIRLSKGPEYHPFVDTLVIYSDTTVTCLMERMIDMRGTGWFSGDVHTHINHSGGFFDLLPSHAHWMGLAEDLLFVNCLDNDFHFTGVADEVSTDECVVYMSEEMRNYVYGHCSLPGLKRLVEPFWCGWNYLLRDVADSVRSQDGPLMIYAHPVTTYEFDVIESWPGSGLGRELPLDAMHGKVDAFEVMSYSNVNGGIELDLWYRLLDCGFRIPPCAGSDAAVNRYDDPPMGGFRTYVKCGQGDPDIYQWLGALASGRTFVTNGPLFREFTVNGSWEPGDSFSLERGVHPFFADVTVECTFSLECVEIVVNGRVVDTLVPGVDPRRITGRSTFYLYEDCWIAARVKGAAEDWFTIGEELFAHTGALYADMDGEYYHKSNAALYFTEWIDSLIDLAHEKGQWQAPEDSTRVFSELGAARDWYAAVAAFSTGTEQPQTGDLPFAPYVTVHPNPFSSTATIRFEVRGASAGREAYNGMRTSSRESRADVRIYDVSGRIVRRLESRSSAPGPREVEWDGTTDDGRKAASGIYFCTVRSGGYSADAKILLIR